MRFTINPLTLEEIPALLELIFELACFEGLEHEVEATEESLAEALFSPGAAAGALMARQNGELAGYAIYFFTFSSFTGRRGLWVDDLYVRPAFRQHGLGRALLRRVAEIALQYGCRRLEWLALHWNQNALSFYEKVGAREMEEWSLLRMPPPAIEALAERKEVVAT
jgi:GNAT superfamily N-acetyltransferase